MSRKMAVRLATSNLPESSNHRLDLYSAAAVAAGVSERALKHPTDGANRPSNATTRDGNGRRVSLCSVAAMAAGVGVLALVQPAEAEVVASKAHLPINATFSALPPTWLDLNHDGMPDVRFSMYSRGYSSFFEANLKAMPQPGGGLAGTSHHTYRELGYGSALKRGAGIGPSAHFVNRGGPEGRGILIERSAGKLGRGGTIYSQHYYGKWVGNSGRYLGVKFLIDGAAHYGWVRIEITTKAGQAISGTITAYAYETIPNKPIAAGAISGSSDGAQVQGQDLQEESIQKENAHGGAWLGMLALGANGVALWRREAVPSN
ncbi:MAG: hypothetical protein WBX38_22180 [Candidatus Sulfotelmatobacter sp.]